MQKFPTEELKRWFLQNKRPLPWRDFPTPYRVWISEVMLQQTQASVVIPYFEKWMEAFPTIEALASASLESVLKCWEGLGYYSRARNLHSAASYVVKHHEGMLPSDAQALARIKGIGPYTQGAILSFAFKQKAAAVDGNVVRVLSRFFAFEEEVESQKSKKQLHNYVYKILPNEDSWLISEALIELGAMVCKKRAHCEACPLHKECLAFRHHMQYALPKKRKRPQTTHLKRTVAIIFSKGLCLVQKVVEGKILAGLHEFPFIEDVARQSDVEKAFNKALGLQLIYVQSFSIQKHSFTRYRAELFPHLLKADVPSAVEGYTWHEIEKLHELPFSSGHRRILTDLLKNEDITY